MFIGTEQNKFLYLIIFQYRYVYLLVNSFETFFVQVTDAGLVALCEHNRRLETLILNYCKITDCAMITVISCLARITKLSLHVSEIECYNF